MIIVSFGDKEIAKGETISGEVTKDELKIDVKDVPINEKYVTIIMYDVTVEKLRLVKTKTKSAKIKKEEILINYAKMNLIKGKHEIMVGVYSHPKKLIELRERGKLELLVEKNEMKLLESFTFYVQGKEKSSKTVEEAPSPKEEAIRDPRLKYKSLPERKIKYCTCLLDTLEANSDECNATRTSWGKAGCKNPYEHCARQELTATDCTPHYKFSTFSDKQLKGYAHIEEVKVPEPYDKEKLIKKLQKSSPSIPLKKKK